MIADKTVSQGSGGCLSSVTERVRFVKSSNRQSLPQMPLALWQRLFATSVAPVARPRGRSGDDVHACRAFDEGADGRIANGTWGSGMKPGRRGRACVRKQGLHRNRGPVRSGRQIPYRAMARRGGVTANRKGAGRNADVAKKHERRQDADEYGQDGWCIRERGKCKTGAPTRRGASGGGSSIRHEA